MRKTVTFRRHRVIAALMSRLMMVCLIALPTVTLTTACDDYDLETPEGINKALNDGVRVKAAMEKLKSVTGDDLKPFGEAMQKRYLAGDEENQEALINKLVSLKDPAYTESYMKALQSGDDNQVRAGADMVGQLKLKEAEEPLIQMFNKYFSMGGKADILQVLIEAGMVLESPRVAEAFATQLFEAELELQNVSNMKSMCLFLSRVPVPKLMPKLVPLIFFRTDAGQSIAQECSAAIKVLGRQAYPEMERLLWTASTNPAMAQKGNEDVRKMISTKGKRLSEGDVQIAAVAVFAVIAEKKSIKTMLEFLQDKKNRIRWPVDLKTKNPTEGKNPNLFGGWAGSVGQGYQEMLLTINKLGIPPKDEAVKKLARDVLLDIAVWDVERREQFSELTKINSGIPAVLRAQALRVLAEQDLLDDATIDRLFAALEDKEFEKDETKRVERLFLLSQMSVSYGVASKAEWMEKIYNRIFALLEADLKALNADKVRELLAQEKELAEWSTLINEGKDLPEGAITAYKKDQETLREQLKGTESEMTGDIDMSPEKIKKWVPAKKGYLVRQLQGRYMYVRTAIEEEKRIKEAKKAFQRAVDCKGKGVVCHIDFFKAKNKEIEALKKQLEDEKAKAAAAGPAKKKGAPAAVPSLSDEPPANPQFKAIETPLLKAIYEIGRSGDTENFNLLLQSYVQYPENYRLEAVQRLGGKAQLKAIEQAAADAEAKGPSGAGAAFALKETALYFGFKE